MSIASGHCVPGFQKKNNSTKERQMRLWIVKRIIDRPVYDVCDGHVIRAPDASEARMMASRASCDEGSDVWFDHNKTSCAEILQSGPAEIILTDFQAG